MLQRNQDKCFLSPGIKLKCTLGLSEKCDSKEDSQADKKTQKERFKMWS